MSRASKTGVRGLYRDEDGRFRIDLRWRDAGSRKWRRYSERFPPGTKAATAKARALHVLNLAMAGELDPDHRDPPSLSGAFDAYERWVAANRPKALRCRRQHRRVLLRVIGDPRIDRLTPWHLEKYKRARREEGAAPGTINRALSTLKHMVGLIARGELAEGKPWLSREQAHAIRDVKLLREPPGRVRYLHDSERVALFAAMPEWLRLLAAAAILTGLRQGALLALRRGQVDLRNRVLTVLRGKDNRTHHVPIADALVPVLEAALARSRCDHAFTNAAGERLVRDSVTTAFSRARAAAGIPSTRQDPARGVRFHDLRHHFASLLVQDGVPIYTVSKLLGHADIKTSSRYAHLGDANLRAAVAGLSDPTAPAKPGPSTTVSSLAPGSRRT